MSTRQFERKRRCVFRVRIEISRRFPITNRCREKKRIIRALFRGLHVYSSLGKDIFPKKIPPISRDWDGIVKNKRLLRGVARYVTITEQRAYRITQQGNHPFCARNDLVMRDIASTKTWKHKISSTLKTLYKNKTH